MIIKSQNMFFLIKRRNSFSSQIIPNIIRDYYTLISTSKKKLITILKQGLIIKESINLYIVKLDILLRLIIFPGKNKYLKRKGM
jgi:hypothetical protein